MALDDEVSTTGATCLSEEGEDAEGRKFPPSTKPLPLNGIIFRVCCDPEAGETETYKFKADKVKETQKCH